MKTRIFPFILSLAIIIAGVGLLGVQNAEAQTSSFPAGCSSALGYSVTTGDPCNGTSTATIGPLPGCTTALGYSVTNGVPCSGGSMAIFFLDGCFSIYGYSTKTGMPCNGTTVASFPTAVVIGGGSTTIPGLPTTGDGGSAFNDALFLLVSGFAGILGLRSIIRQSRAS